MLYIVQAVMWGVAEKPELFAEEEKARSAYVAATGKNWAQRYAAYCEHHGVSGDSFASAEGFVKTLDVSEKSTVNFWTFDLEEAGSGEQKEAGDADRRVAQGIVAVREGLARLLDDVTRLAETFVSSVDSPVEAEAPVGEMKSLPPPGSAPDLKDRRPEPTPEACARPEWQTFLATVKRLATGPRNDFALLTRDDWRQDVYSSRTSLEYWDWVADRIMKYKETAVGAGCTVSQHPDSPGCWTFGDLEGITAEGTFDSEWEGWCAAGLHVEGSCRSAAV
jgi:hypothetical protein